MGSRTTWKIDSGQDLAIHLYSHYDGGDKLRATAESLLRAKSRWHDPDYFRRIFVSWIINDSWDRDLGYGLYAGYMADDYFEENYTPVEIYPEERLIDWGSTTFTYEEFIAFAGGQMSSQAQIAVKERI